MGNPWESKGFFIFILIYRRQILSTKVDPRAVMVKG